MRVRTIGKWGFRLCLTFAFVASAACTRELDGPRGDTGCDTSDDCPAGWICAARFCLEAPIPDLGLGVDAFMCPLPRQCEDRCCDEGLVCGGELCCAIVDLCGSECCSIDETCIADRCVFDCGTRATCGSPGHEVCCPVGELCYLDACITPGPSCRSTNDCPSDSYCEDTAERCLPLAPATTTVCEYHPPVGDAVELEEEWRWMGDAAVLPYHYQVMMAPMVANLSDDNSDGVVDVHDTPDIVFNTFRATEYRRDGILRAISGADGTRLWPTSDPGYRTWPGAEIALGDVDAESPGVEVVACAATESEDEPGHMILVARDGALLREFPTVPCGFDAPAIGDMDNDGVPEIVMRYAIAHADGTVVRTIREVEGTGGPYNTLADLDGDGTLEMVSSAGAYHYDGTPLWERLVDDPVRPAISARGFVAIGDLDLDGSPEVIVVVSREHSIQALDGRTGDTVWGPFDINPTDDPTVLMDIEADGSQMGQGGGPPTIANFDSDPNPEIAFAGGFAYVIFNHDGTRLWHATTLDRSSRMTGSSVFDFEGDGVAEVAYNDERNFHIYRGPDGMLLFDECNTSGTLSEYPIVVDVDNDDHAEIILMQNNYAFRCEDGTWSSKGIRVLGHPRNEWVRTRRIWNQHTYHVTNVNEDGTIPSEERPNWSTPGLNNFRQNVQPDGLFNAPDLVLNDLRATTTHCSEGVGLSVRVVNRGTAGAPREVPVTFYDTTNDPAVRVGTMPTSRPLLPGESEIVELRPSFRLPAGVEAGVFRFTAVINDPADVPRRDVHECDVSNNTVGPIDAHCRSLE